MTDTGLKSLRVLRRDSAEVHATLGDWSWPHKGIRGGGGVEVEW